LKVNLHISDDIDDRNQDDDDDGNFFCELEGDDTQTNTDDDDEVLRYAKLGNIKVKDDPLIWWVNHRDSFPTLLQLARKYLSIPTTSVPSE